MQNSKEHPNTDRIILIRHGRPQIEVAPRKSAAGFRDYIVAYDEAGLDPADVPPKILQEMLSELQTVFTSHKRRARESAKALAPAAELAAEPSFAEAPLAGPRIPLLRMRVSKWAVIARVLWHAGYNPKIENYSSAKRRAADAADILERYAKATETAALVAHGYFNFLIGRELRRRGFLQSGAHRARFWNAVLYERPKPTS